MKLLIENWRGFLNEIDDQQHQFLKNKLADVLNRNPDHKPLFDKLLELGGMQVVATWEEDLFKIMSRGEAMDADASVLVGGSASQCHGNVACLWANDPDDVTIYTGWALSHDGLWRQHSWAFDNLNGEILETTEQREMYFGFAMNMEEAIEFEEDNY